MRIAVVIPAYNEAGNIGPLIEETIVAVPAAKLAEVIVVDDASDDGADAEIQGAARPPQILALSPPWPPGRSKRRASQWRRRRHAPGHRHVGRRRTERPWGHHAALGEARKSPMSR
jgi:glycosyltransferase involved in cell wall biosynthesis